MPAEPAQPTDLLAARASAPRPRGFLDKPGFRKFVRNRPGMAALAIIALFVLMAALIIFPPHILTAADVQARVGPGDLPGLGLASRPEARIEVADFFVRQVRKALDTTDPGASLELLRFAERELAPMSPDEARVALESAEEAFADLDRTFFERENSGIALEQVHARTDAPAYEIAAAEARVRDAEALFDAALARVETAVDVLFPRPSGFRGLVYSLRLIAGTDRMGRSIAFRAVFSAKTAVQIGMVTALFSVAFGAVLGGAAGYFGGMVDHAVVWLYSTLSSIPYIIWLVVIAFVFRESEWVVPISGKPIAQTLIPVYLAFAVTLWVGTCRVVRGEAMKIKGLDYIQAAVAIGCSPARVLARHVLPNVAYLMFINFSLAFVAAIKGEVILSYLGLGVQGQPSWGIMIRDSKDHVVLGNFWELGAATLLMFVLVYAFNILSDALQDAFDPKHLG